MSDTAPYNTSEIDEAVTRLMETREKFLHTLYEQRIAEAVAAERLEIGQMLDSKADEWSRKAHADPRPEHDPRAMAMHDAYREAAHLVYARAGEGEQVPMSHNPNCET